MNEPSIELLLQVSTGAGESDEELDRATRDLRDELLGAGTSRAELVESKVPPPPGAKGPVEHLIGNIAVAAVSAMIPRLLEILKEWKTRSHGRGFKGRVLIDGHPSDILFDDLEANHALATARVIQHYRNAYVVGRHGSG
jgi:hypothetical protein